MRRSWRHDRRLGGRADGQPNGSPTGCRDRRDEEGWGCAAQRDRQPPGYRSDDRLLGGSEGHTSPGRKYQPSLRSSTERDANILAYQESIRTGSPISCSGLLAPMGSRKGWRRRSKRCYVGSINAGRLPPTGIIKTRPDALSTPPMFPISGDLRNLSPIAMFLPPLEHFTSELDQWPENPASPTTFATPGSSVASQLPRSQSVPALANRASTFGKRIGSGHGMLT